MVLRTSGVSIAVSAARTNCFNASAFLVVVDWVLIKC